MDPENALRDQLVRLLRGGMAHMTFDEAVADFPMEHINRKPPHVPYTSWHLLEHLRFSQRDILDFIVDPEYQEPSWPAAYWPPQDKDADVDMWAETIRAFREDLQTLQALATDPATDLYASIAKGTGQTILRELLLVADHNAYHIGEFAILRQIMQTWPVEQRQDG